MDNELSDGGAEVKMLAYVSKYKRRGIMMLGEGGGKLIKKEGIDNCNEKACEDV